MLLSSTAPWLFLNINFTVFYYWSAFGRFFFHSPYSRLIFLINRSKYSEGCSLPNGLRKPQNVYGVGSSFCRHGISRACFLVSTGEPSKSSVDCHRLFTVSSRKLLKRTRIVAFPIFTRGSCSHAFTVFDSPQADISKSGGRLKTSHPQNYPWFSFSSLYRLRSILRISA